MSEYLGIHIPSGSVVSIGDSADELRDIGVIPMETETTLEVTYDTVRIQGSRREVVQTWVRNLKAEMKTEIYQVVMATLADYLGGLMHVTEQQGEAVTGASHTIASPRAGRLYVLPGQNHDHAPQNVTSVMVGEASESGYTQVQDAQGLWGLAFSADHDGTATVAYGYTPAAYSKATMGGNHAEIEPKVVRISKTQDGKIFQVTLWSAVATGGLRLSFPGADADDLVKIPIEMSGGLDPDRTSGEQLLEIVDEIGVAG